MYSSCPQVSVSNSGFPVLSNIEPPALWRKAASDKLVEKIVTHDSWPIQPDILNPPLLRLTSRKPLWLDLQPADIKSRWRHNWKSAWVVNSHLLCDPTVRQLSFALPWQQWSLKWQLADTDLSLRQDSMVWKCVHGVAPAYVSDLNVPTTAISGRQHLRSAASGTLLVPHARNSPNLNTAGERSFTINGPATWNRLPPALRSPDLSESAFKRALKTHLFSTARHHWDVFPAPLRCLHDSDVAYNSRLTYLLTYLLTSQTQQ